MSADELARLRAKLDEIDDRLVELLAERWRSAEQIGAVKRADEGMAVVDRARESQVLRRVQAAAGDRLPAKFLESVYREIFSASVACQAALKVCYLGPAGSFTHAAALKSFGRSASYLGEPTIKACIDTVEHRRADYAVVPYENSTEGGVGDTLDSLVETELVACSETQLRIHHNLVAAPGVAVPAVAKLYSHPQSFAQCRKWLNVRLPNCPQVECASNSAAAQQAAKTRDAAAIGPAGLAELYDMQVLAPNIEDNPHNITRFLSLGRKPTEPSGDDRSSLLLAVRDEPGALHRMLQLIADAGVNMSRLESRPMPGVAFAQYMFFIDTDGHCGEQPLKNLLVKLRGQASFLKVLGSYPRTAVSD